MPLATKPGKRSVVCTLNFAGFTFGAAIVGTDTKAYMGGPSMKNLGKDGFVVSVKKTF